MTFPLFLCSQPRESSWPRSSRVPTFALLPDLLRLQPLRPLLHALCFTYLHRTPRIDLSKFPQRRTDREQLGHFFQTAILQLWDDEEPPPASCRP